MAYNKKYYKKSYKKANNKSYGKKASLYSKKNLYKNKSAKKQATQIYELNKKVKHIVNQIRPETQIVEKPIVIYKFTENEGQGQYGVQSASVSFSLIRQKLFNAPEPYAMHGRIMRFYNIYIYGQFTNTNMCYPTNLTSGGVTGLVNLTAPLTGYLRILLVKPKKGITTLPANITKSFEEDKSDIGLITGPLCSDIGNYCNIVKEKIVKISNTKEMTTFKIKIPSTSYYITQNTEDPYDVGDYYMYIQYYMPQALHHQINQEDKIVAPIHYLRMYAKYVFVDQD